MKSEKDVRILTTCAPPRCQCPEMELDYLECLVEIRDDYGGTCKMSFLDMANLARQFLAEV